MDFLLLASLILFGVATIRTQIGVVHIGWAGAFFFVLAALV